MRYIRIQDLQNEATIDKICNETESPVFVSDDKDIKLVVMNITCFDNFFWKTYEQLMIEEGLKDVEEGRVSDANEFMKELKKKYNF